MLAAVLAQEAAKKAGVNSRFLLMDAEAMSFNELFNVVWSIESISHYKNRDDFFKKACQLLEPDGTIAVIDWFKRKLDCE